MGYDNNDRRYPGLVEDAAGLTQLLENEKYVAGKSAGQTTIVTEAPLSFEDWLESKHASKFDFVKAADASDVAEMEYEAQAASGTDIEDTASVLRQAITQIGGTQQNLGDIAFTRVDAGAARLSIMAIFSGAPAGFLTVDENGFLGVLTDVPEYELDIASGTINVSGDYYRSGVLIGDWTEVAGPKVQWAGPAVVTNVAQTTVGAGTAPMVAASTTENPNLDADLLNGHGQHPGIQASGSATYAASDTQIAITAALGKAGEWDIDAIVSVVCDPADDGREIVAKLKDNASVQIGDTGNATAKKVTLDGFDDVSSISLHIHGKYVAAAGTETVKVTVGVTGGVATGSIAEAVITAHWVQP